MSATPWSMERRSRASQKIVRECARAAARLGADGVAMVAFFRAGEHLHMIDAANNIPISLADLWKKLASVHGIVEATGGEDVQLQ